MNSSCVDLIYLDPPFNSKANYAAPIGSPAEGAAFKDVWSLSDIKAAWLDRIRIQAPLLFRVISAAITDSDKGYLAYMAPRLVEMHRLLKDTGSLFLHCDPTMSHYIKLMLDSIFGRKCFRNEIIWCYEGAGRSKKTYAKKHDVIFWYSKKQSGYKFPGVKVDFSEAGRKLFKKKDDNGDLYYIDGKGYKYYLKDGKHPNDWWADIPAITHHSRERAYYPTQKPLKLLRRIIESTTDSENDVVFDPFCGCATTLVAADQLGRSWIGVDLSEKAAELVVRRIKQDQGLFENIVHRTELPFRTDQGRIPKYNCQENKTHLYGLQKGLCNACLTHFHFRNLTVDHIEARSEGGSDEISNLQLLCGACNSKKGNRGMDYLMAALNIEKGGSGARMPI